MHWPTAAVLIALLITITAIVTTYISTKSGPKQ